MAEGRTDSGRTGVREDPVAGIDRSDGAIVVSLAGELDLYNAAAVREALLECCDEAPERLIVDLSDVKFIDSTALGVLIEARTRLANRRGFLLAAPGLETRRALEISGPRPALRGARVARRRRTRQRSNAAGHSIQGRPSPRTGDSRAPAAAVLCDWSVLQPLRPAGAREPNGGVPQLRSPRLSSARTRPRRRGRLRPDRDLMAMTMFAVVSAPLVGVLLASVAQQKRRNERTLAAQTAQTAIESIRSLPYDSIGVANGNPAGSSLRRMPASRSASRASTRR